MRGWGRMVKIASACGRVGSPYKAAYVAAKDGLGGLTKVVALDTAGSGSTANAVCPGWVRTLLVEKQISDIATRERISQQEAAAALLGEKQPSRTFVTPEQLGETVARSEEHTSELQSLMRISYAVFCLKKKKKCQITTKRIDITRQPHR